MRRSTRRVTVMSVLAMLWIALLGGSGVARAQDFDQASCDEFLVPLRDVKGTPVGPASCLMQETDVEFEGRTFRRLDIGLDGTVEGYVTKTGDYKEYLTNAPDLVFPQTADAGPRYLAIARYERDKGASMTVVYPLDGSAWNGKMWVTVHGRGAAVKLGTLRPWNENLERSNPLHDLTKYERLMLSKGYVLAKTRRTSAEGLGEVLATLEDGSSVDCAAFNDTARYIMDFTAVAEKAVERRLGRTPSRTYFYGHSAGARIGRGLNYTPGLNAGADGKPLFDGILADDSAAGTWLPVVITDGKDVLFATEAEKAAFVPQLEITHQMYNNIWRPRRPEWVTPSFLANKRYNAKILRDKGLGEKHRVYEVRGISHSGGESLAEDSGEAETLDLSKMMDMFIDMLDAWVDRGVAPPPSRSDWAELGDADGDGRIENAALAFPEVACPLGVYVPHPTRTSGSTSFAAFSGEPDLEPLDGDGIFVDMNGNGVRDYRESAAAAWRRLGLLKKDEPLTRERYESCVRNAAEALRQAGFFSEATARWYFEWAKGVDIDPGAAAREPTR